MAIFRLLLAALGALAFVVQGCSGPTADQGRAQPPTFAQAAPNATTGMTESWASVMPMPGFEQDTLAYARRDTALGLPPPGYSRAAGAWQPDPRPSIDRYFLVPLPRSPRTLLFFDAPNQYERRAPRVPPGAHPRRTAW